MHALHHNFSQARAWSRWGSRYKDTHVSLMVSVRFNRFLSFWSIANCKLHWDAVTHYSCWSGVSSWGIHFPSFFTILKSSVKILYTEVDGMPTCVESERTLQCLESISAFLTDLFFSSFLHGHFCHLFCTLQWSHLLFWKICTSSS